MKLRLISPDEEFEYILWQDARAPAVVVATTEDGNQRVWVRGASSTAYNQMYFEQSGIIDNVYLPGLTRAR